MKQKPTPTRQQRRIVKATAVKTSGRYLNGYLLPLVIVLGLAFSVVVVFELLIVGQSSQKLNSQEDTRMANEAAESGLAFAQSCLEQSSWQPTWYNATPLGANTDCAGSVRLGCAEPNPSDHCYIVKTGEVGTSFAVTYVLKSDGTVSDLTSEGKVERYTAGEVVHSEKVYKKQRINESPSVTTTPY